MGGERTRFTPERAREAGRRSARARRAKSLNFERVQAELGPLQTRQDARRRLDRLSLWLASGLISGSAGGAAVRAMEVWLRDLEAEATFEAIEELRRTVEQLTAERDALRQEVEQLQLELAQARRSA